MRVHSLSCGCFLLLCLAFAVSLCNADNDNTFEVVGLGECADCKENNFKNSQAFSGLLVSIDCKLKDGKMKRFGVGELDEEGKFKVSIPEKIVEEGQKLKETCYAQLHSAAAVPCAAHNGLEASKIVFKSQINVPIQKPPVEKPPVYKPPVYKPPVEKPPVYKPKPHKKPCPPVHKPPVEKPPVYKPPVEKPPVYKPPVEKPPVYKPPVEKPPVYKPPVEKPPVYKPPVEKPPVYKPPVEKPPVYKPPVEKPHHPLYPFPPFFKKPCPPLPKIFHHPKFGHYPPLPPFHP